MRSILAVRCKQPSGAARFALTMVLSSVAVWAKGLGIRNGVLTVIREEDFVMHFKIRAAVRSPQERGRLTAAFT